MPQLKTIDEILDHHLWGDEHNRENAAKDIADLLLGLPSLQDEDIGVVHREFNTEPKEKHQSDDAYMYAGGMVNGRNHLRRQIRHEIAASLGVKE